MYPKNSIVVLHKNVLSYLKTISRRMHLNNYSKTLNLPNPGKFSLSMKNIYENEEKIKKLCNFESLYNWNQVNRKNSEKEFILHDGPPYANGYIHMGHMVNKILKDIVIRYKMLDGFRINYKPGWDCHGLPIELNAIKNLNKMDDHKKSNQTNLVLENKDLETRQIANEFADKFVKSQMGSFKKLNLIADWSKTYQTKSPEYLCDEIDLFYDLYKNGLIYRDYKPVYWSLSSQTALAEAELEYNPIHKSQAVYVAFEIKQFSDTIKNFIKNNQKLYCLIWTTTKWTLPGNRAISFNENLKYNLIDINDNVYIISHELTSDVIKSIPSFSQSKVEILATIEGNALHNTTYFNPFFTENDGTCPLLHSDHVNVKQGTGLVHIAPAFGHDDFKLALKHKLRTESVIDELGFYDKNNDNLKKIKLNGINAFDNQSNVLIESILEKSLINQHELIHSYPYDWRTNKPVIIRASKQWFINTNKLKELCLDVLKDVKIRPVNTSNSMISSISSRPYWCISRQRVWGLPIPCIYNNDDEPIIDENLITTIKSLINLDGNINFWWSNKYDNEIFNKYNMKLKKSKDIFDIWFDSGASFKNVIKEKQADLYCEGTDQFSGWFQSSLLLSVALRGKAPYKSLLVHGFVVDEQNRKMSKSVGNVIEPMQAIKGDVKKGIPQCGLDVLRFWIAHEHHKPQIQIGSDILKKMVNRVFEVRSIIRFLVGNTSDMNLESGIVPYNSLLPIDKYILHKMHQLTETCIKNYDDLYLNRILIPLETFLITELSSFYINAVKDRLYCEPKDSIKRLTAQATILMVLQKLIALIAPIMPHLAEEAYLNSILYKNDDLKSLFQNEKLFNFNNIENWKNEDISKLFDIVHVIRNRFHNIRVSDNPAMYDLCLECDKDLLNKLEKEFPDGFNEYFGTSSLELKLLDLQKTDDTNRETIKIEDSQYNFKLDVRKVTSKYACERCRRYINGERHSLCERCNNCLKIFNK